MSVATVFGWLACVSTFIFFSVGSPTQIIKHYREKRVGLTAFYAAWPLTSHLFWLGRGVTTKDPFLIWVNAFALVMVSIICAQKFIIYRGK